MKRLAFIAFSIAAALSLLLCTALLAVWLAAPSSGVRIEWGRADMSRPSRSRYQVRVVGGQVEFSRRYLAVTAGPNSPEADDYRRAFQFEIDSYALRPRVERVGDVTRTVSTIDHWTYTTFPNNPAVAGYESYWAAHDWVLAAIAAVLPALWLLRQTARRAARNESGAEAAQPRVQSDQQPKPGNDVGPDGRGRAAGNKGVAG